MNTSTHEAAPRNTLHDIAIRASDDLTLRMSLRRNPESTVKALNLEPDAEKALITRRASEIQSALHQSEQRGISSMLTIMICIVDNACHTDGAELLTD